MGVLGPEGAQPGVEFDRFFLRLRADAVSSFDGSPSDSGGFEENHDLIAQKFFLQGGSDGLEVTGRVARPVGGPIDSAAVAEQAASRVERGLDVFKVALHMKDPGLGGFEGYGVARAGEPAFEQDGRGFRDDDDAIADFPAKEVGGGGFATARATRENDATDVLGWFHKGRHYRHRGVILCYFG